MESLESRAVGYRDEILGRMNELRVLEDEMETMTRKTCWPYPCIGDLIFSVQ